ncbi:carbohydrate sulfotransferase 15 [Plakobranchus ocellatus]|uniref:Carbohydrate sulfotransferase 15 n=1 Tax=Plakobranchus ocellatus TaxID=259542 RepID=A0AAV4DCE2_9GAST|nr:carbohydrate sulfotransferase 15 [Plakobranchus ocellatus]
MPRSAKIFRLFKVGASCAGVMTLAASLAWLMTTTSPGFPNKKLLRQETSSAGSNRATKHNYNALQDEEAKQKVLASLFPHKSSADRKQNVLKKKVKHPGFPFILKMVADDDFNFTCSFIVPKQDVPTAIMTERDAWGVCKQDDDDDDHGHDVVDVDDDDNDEMMILMMCNEHRKFLRSAKSPCYWDKAQNNLKCLPYFYVPGFPKCGTTDFYNAIKEHPEFLRTGKEHHWFNFVQYTNKFSDFDVYLQPFQRLANKVQEDLKTQSYSRRITGDFTPDYLCDSMRWRCMEGNEESQTPRYTNAHAIHRLNPNAKIIILLREPVERLYSRFKHMIHVSKRFQRYWGHPTPGTFHEASMRAIQLYSDCLQLYPPRQCLYNDTVFKKAMMNDLGFYPVCLQDWVDVFPKENFFFIQFEDYIQNRTRTFDKVFEFLDMAPIEDQELQKAMTSTKIFNTGFFKAEPMLEKTKEALRLFFSPFVQDLKKIPILKLPDLILGRDAGGGVRTPDRRTRTDLRAGSLPTAPPKPLKLKNMNKNSVVKERTL